jgi:hypothetical protein
MDVTILELFVSVLWWTAAAREWKSKSAESHFSRTIMQKRAKSQIRAVDSFFLNL